MVHNPDHLSWSPSIYFKNQLGKHTSVIPACSGETEGRDTSLGASWLGSKHPTMHRCKFSHCTHLWCPQQAEAGPQTASPQSRSLGQQMEHQLMTVAVGVQGGPTLKTAATLGRSLVCWESTPCINTPYPTLEC